MYCLSPVISYRTLQWIFLGIVLTAAATAAGSLLYYAFHFEEITESYKHAKTLPVVIPHIRYSLIVSIAIAFAVQLGRENFQWKFIRAPFLYAVAVFLFIFLHILAVRSGLLALYAGWITVILAQVFYTKSYRYLWAFPILLLIGGALYWFSPSLRNKAHYMKQDVGRFTSGKNVNNYSDGNRLLSMKIGWEIAKDHLWTGVGSGDAQQVMQAYYAQHYPEIEPHNRLIPHNQFIYILLILGIPGLLVFIALLSIPLMIKNIFQDIPVVIVLVSLYSSFLSEATLEIQQGVFIASYLVGLAYWKAVAQRPLAERVS
jgi:O-antigen ligase